MPKLIYLIDTKATPLEITAQSITAVRVREYALKKGLVMEERNERDCRHLLLAIPVDELNTVLDELLFAGLLNPLQEIHGRPAAHIVLAERFATLTWIDEKE